MRAKLYKCDDCGREDNFTSYKKARSASWAVAKDYAKCYCPDCAPAHRNGKAMSANTKLPDGWKQLKIENF